MIPKKPAPDLIPQVGFTRLAARFDAKLGHARVSMVGTGFRTRSCARAPENKCPGRRAPGTPFTRLWAGLLDELADLVHDRLRRGVDFLDQSPEVLAVLGLQVELLLRHVGDEI